MMTDTFTGQGKDSVAGWLTNGELIAEAKREQLRPIAANIYKAFGDSDDTRTILKALCQKPHNAPPGNSPVPPPERTEWLVRCRAWARREGYELKSTHVPQSLQRAYETATGDAYEGPANGPRLRVRKAGYAEVDARSKSQVVRRDRERAVASQAAEAFGAFDRRQDELEALRRRYGADLDAD